MVLFYIAAAGAPAAAWLSNSLTVGALATHACAYWFGFSVLSTLLVMLLAVAAFLAKPVLTKKSTLKSMSDVKEWGCKGPLRDILPEKIVGVYYLHLNVGPSLKEMSPLIGMDTTHGIWDPATRTLTMTPDTMSMLICEKQDDLAVTKEAMRAHNGVELELPVKVFGAKCFKMLQALRFTYSFAFDEEFRLMQVTLRLFGLNILPGLTDLIGKVKKGFAPYWIAFDPKGDGAVMQRMSFGNVPPAERASTALAQPWAADLSALEAKHDSSQGGGGLETYFALKVLDKAGRVDQVALDKQMAAWGPGVLHGDGA